MNRGTLQRWYDDETIPGVLFQHNDHVRILAVSGCAQNASAISLEGTDPEPRSLVEPDVGKDIVVSQTWTP